MRKHVQSLARRYTPLIVVYPVLILLMSTASAHALDKRVERGGSAFKFGFLAGADFTINGVEESRNDGLTIGTALEFPLIRLTKLAISFDFYDIQVFGEREWMLDASVGIKPIISIEKSQMAVKPGFGLGYGRLGPLGLIDASDFLTWKTSVEVMFLENRRFAYLIELLFVGAKGGNADVDITSSPTMSLRVGVIY